jgi:AcrR family transcriptional regulator
MRRLDGRELSAVDARGQRTRELILTATAQLIGREGWDAVTVRKIASAAGINPALVNYHFGSKDDLMLAALESALEAEVAAPLHNTAAETVPEPPSVIADLVRLTLGSQIPGDARRLFESALAAVVRDPDVAASIRPTLRRFRGLLTDVFDRAITAGTMPPTDTDALAIVCTAMLDGLWLHSLIDPEMPTGRIVEEVVKLLSDAPGHQSPT